MHTFHLDWTRPPLTENQRLHHHAKARVVKDVRLTGRLLTAGLRDSGRVEVWLTWFVKDARKRDEDNLVPTLKALCDGMVDAGVVPDDTARYMVKHMPVIVLDRDQPPHFTLTVSVLGANLD